MRLRRASLSVPTHHLRSESQRSVSYDGTTASSPRVMAILQPWKHWKLLAVIVITLAALNYLLASSVVGRSASAEEIKLIIIAQRQLFATSTFHVLVTATGTNKYLCQFLLSSILLNYPTPVLLNWDASEQFNTAEYHVAKLEAVKNHLDSFPSTADDDIVMILDGHDVWLQLPADVVLRRYFAAVKVLDKRAKTKSHTTVLFTADKACWPTVDREYIGCWAAPESTLPLWTFGPYNDTSVDDALQAYAHARPRWLNTGIIIGPVGDLRSLYGEASSMMQQDEIASKDVVYFSQIFGLQEYSRLRASEGDNMPLEGVAAPDIDPRTIPDFHIGLDYSNSIFQPVGYNDQYMTWWQYDGSKEGHIPKEARQTSKQVFQLTPDVVKARRPFEAMHSLKMSAYNEKYQEILRQTGHPNFKMWQHLPLATNVVTRQVFALMHFTFEKDYQNIWWEKMWFYPYARDLLRASATSDPKSLYHRKIAHRTWQNAQTPVTPYQLGANQERRDGAWTQAGEWKSFHAICSLYEEDLFGTSFDSTVLNY